MKYCYTIALIFNGIAIIGDKAIKYPSLASCLENESTLCKALDDRGVYWITVQLPMAPDSVIELKG